MTTYYVSPDYGADTNNGLGPDASAATNKPWKTLAKFLSTGATGDTCYVAPGISYEGASLTVPASVFSNAMPTSIIGDPMNAQGFKSAAGVRVSPGVCWITARTSSEGQDGPMAATASLIDASAGVGKGGLQFSNLALECQFQSTGASILALNVAGAGNSDWLFEDCLLIGALALSISGTPLASRNVTFRRCEMLVNVGSFGATIGGNPATADIDLNILFESCVIRGRASNAFSLAGAGGNLAGGIRWRWCDLYANNVQTSTVFNSTAGRVSTVTPCEITGCKAIGGIIVSAGTAGHFISGGYNRFLNGGADVNFSPDPTDKYGFLPMLRFSAVVKWGIELPNDDQMGWLAQAVSAQKFSGGSTTVTGFRGRTPRPWGGGPSVGAWEFADVAQDTGGAISGGGANSLKITGAGEISLFVPINAAATTLTIKTKSTGYGGTNYPQMIAEAVPEAGLSQQTATATDGTEQTLTIGPFTPSQATVLELRLISRSTSGASATYFDVLAAS